MKHCTKVSQSSLSHTHTHLSAPVSSAPMTSRAYTPDSFSQPRLQQRHNIHSHPSRWNRDPEEGKRSPAPNAGAWADVAWHGQNKARRFFTATLSIKARSVRTYLLPVWRLHGNPLWRHHLVSVSGSQHEWIRRRKKEGDVEERQHSMLLHSLLYWIASGNCCPFSQILINLL